MDNEYRITTNGFGYRIENKRIAWWSNRLVWRPIGMNGAFPALAYNTLEDARNALQRLKDGENSDSDEWRPIE